MSQYPELRKVLAPQYRALPAEDIEALLEGINLSAEDMEGFLDTLKDIGSGIVKAAPAILPVAGTVLGTVVGGPAGAALGGTLGKLAGGAISQAKAPRPARVPSAPRLPMPMPGSSPAAGQLLQTLFRPETMRSLVSMLLGQLGASNVKVGSTPVPVGAFTNLLGSLANLAQAEYTSANPQIAEGLPSYLQGFAGEAVGDPAVAENRARILFEMLQESDLEQEPEADGEASLVALPMAEDQYYDALELAEMYADSEIW
jgi:hypothetical protein